MTGVHQVVASSGGGSPYLYDIIVELGLTTSLNFVLDAADSRSYDGTSQTWTDITGNGNSFFRGLTSGATSTDPTFNGSVGTPTESTYFSSDGDDLFVESAAHTFSDNWHKDNGAFSLVFIFYAGNVTTDQALYGTFDSVNGDGIILFIDNAAGEVGFVHSLTNTTSETVSMTTTVPGTTWSVFGFSFNEATTTAICRVNSTTNSKTTGASTNTTNPSSPNYIFTEDGVTPMTAGSRLMAVAAWSTALTDANLEAIYSRVKARRCPSMP